MEIGQAANPDVEIPDVEIIDVEIIKDQ